jgi:hypothetical protein
MSFPRQTSLAVLADAWSAAQAERAENSGPDFDYLALKPAHDVGGCFGLVHTHVRIIPHAQVKKSAGNSQKKRQKRLRLKGTPRFATETS